MVREIVKDPARLTQRADYAGVEDLETARDLLDTLAAHRDDCVGMAANMIGVNRRVIVFENDGADMVMFNPEIVKVSERAVSNPAEDLHRLDGGDHPARDRSL